MKKKTTITLILMFLGIQTFANDRVSQNDTSFFTKVIPENSFYVAKGALRQLINFIGVRKEDLRYRPRVDAVILSSHRQRCGLIQMSKLRKAFKKFEDGKYLNTYLVHEENIMRHCTRNSIYSENQNGVQFKRTRSLKCQVTARCISNGLLDKDVPVSIHRESKL